MAAHRLVTGMSSEKYDSLRYVRGLLEDGTLRVVVDGRFPLEAIVQAHKLVDTGHKRGNVIVDVAT